MHVHVGPLAASVAVDLAVGEARSARPDADGASLRGISTGVNVS